MAFVFTKFSDALLADEHKALQYAERKLRQHALQIVPKSVPKLSQSIRNVAEGVVYLAKANKLPQPQLAPADVVANEVKILDERLQKQVESRKACMLKSDEKSKIKAGLQSNEVVQEERFTYLEVPFKDIPKYTAVLARRTDKAEYCLIAVGYLFYTAQVRSQLNCPDAVVYQITKVQVQSSAVKEIAKALGLGLISGVAGKIGVLIFDEIFPPGLPSYFDEVYKQIEQIVNQELTQSTIDEINGQINGMKDWIAITYTNAKESGYSKQELTDLLQPREPEIAIQLIGVLMEERYAQIGICVFMIAGGMHLAILQELALVDPKNAPNASAYAKSVQDYAALYADHATNTTNDIMNARKNKIQPKNETYNNGSAFYNYYWFEDSLTGYRSQDWLNTVDYKGENNPDAANQRNDAMAQYKTDKVNQLTADMSDPVGTANEWRKLVDQPIPDV